MFIAATLVWVTGLLTIVPYGTYYLFFRAERDQWAMLIALVMFWIFGFWGVVVPRPRAAPSLWTKNPADAVYAVGTDLRCLWDPASEVQSALTSGELAWWYGAYS